MMHTTSNNFFPPFVTERDRKHGKALKKIILTSKPFEEHLFAGRKKKQHSIYYLEASFLKSDQDVQMNMTEIGEWLFRRFRVEAEAKALQPN